ncbi:hypothetical protein C8J31_11490 [Rhizobium sp. PP-CC-2G-626]|nr:hypothetical protein C8J31_11490 [Rhizobium sp. PP-CC-2G-626]
MTEIHFSESTIPASSKRSHSEGYLRSKHNQLTGFDNVEDLATDVTRLGGVERDAIVHHLTGLRATIARVLWRAGYYIGTSVLDEFVFEAVKSGQPNVCDLVLGSLRDAGVDRAGFVLYPLTEFGMEIPLFGSDPDLQNIAVFREANFAVTEQTGSLEAAYERMNEMAAALEIVAVPDRSSFDHHVRAGNMEWITRNPLMLVRLASHTGSYYENQFIYTLKIRIASAMAVMIHALSVEAGITVEKFNSSAEVNNFQTLDIRHYLIGEATQAGQPLNLRRVPMNVAALEMARLSDLPVTLSTRALARPELNSVVARLTPALRAVENGYLRYVDLTSGERVHSRVFRRLVTAIDWYRQSFGSKTKEAEAIVALAVAFETLLTDHYARGSVPRLERRVGICLGAHPDVRRFQDSVIAVHKARSEIVHTGDGGHETDIKCAQAAFALCFLDVASRLEHLDRKMADPIRELLGDNLSPEEIEAKAGG